MDSQSQPVLFDQAAAEKIRAGVQRILEEYPTPRYGGRMLRGMTRRCGVWVEVTSNTTYSPPDGSGDVTLGGAFYAGYILDFHIAPDVTTTFGKSMLGTRGQPVLIANFQELDQDTHDLKVDGSLIPTVFPALYWDDHDDGTPIYLIDAEQWENCTT